MIIQELNKNFGCYIDGFDTADSSDSARVCMIKRALSKYKFVVMRGLNLEASALEKLGSKFGQFADDPIWKVLTIMSMLLRLEGMHERQPHFWK